MKLSMNLRIIICILFISLGCSYGTIIHIYEEHYEISRVPEKLNHWLLCNCSNEIKSAKLTKEGLERMFQRIQNRTFCVKNGTKICDWLKTCNTCDAELEECAETIAETGVGYKCTKKTLEMKDRHLINIIPDTVKLGELRHKALKARKAREAPPKARKAREAPPKSRKAREPPPIGCLYPLGMKLSSLSVLKYPSSIRITQKCIFGHTLPEGISRKMRCDYAEDKWKPTGFEECKPFVDCTIQIISTGEVTCDTGGINKAPLCNVSCGRYEDKPEVPQATYECQIYGGWKPKLPYCASGGTGIALVPAPNVKLHKEPEPETKSPAKSPPKKARKGNKDNEEE